MAKHKIVSVGRFFPGIEQIAFYSNDSLTPYDVVIIDPVHVLHSSPGLRHDHNVYYEIGGNDVYAFAQAFSQRRSELKALLANGKLIITFLSPPYNINYGVYGGPAGHVGNYFWLPNSNAVFFQHLVGISGKGLKPYGDEKESHLFTNYLRAFKGDLYFDAYLNLVASSFGDGTVFVINSTQHVVGFSVSVSKGMLVFLPYYPPTKENDEKFIGVISHITKEYFGTHVRTESPPWADYVVPGTVALETAVDHIEEQIDALQRRMEQLEEEQLHLEDFKALLYEKGDLLQTKVVEAFRLMGFNAETVPIANTDLDVVLQSEEGRAIAEVEGKDNEAIHKDKIDQLLSAVNQDADATGAFAKGILVGNHYRLINPSDRGDPFTPTVLSLAKQYGYALITSVDLFQVAVYLLEHPDDEAYKAECRKSILKTSGNLVKFPGKQV